MCVCVCVCAESLLFLFHYNYLALFKFIVTFFRKPEKEYKNVLKISEIIPIYYNRFLCFSIPFFRSTSVCSLSACMWIYSKLNQMLLNQKIVTETNTTIYLTILFIV